MTPRPKQATKLRDVCIHTRAGMPLTGTLASNKTLEAPVACPMQRLLVLLALLSRAACETATVEIQSQGSLSINAHGALNVGTGAASGCDSSTLAEILQVVRSLADRVEEPPPSPLPSSPPPLPPSAPPFCPTTYLPCTVQSIAHGNNAYNLTGTYFNIDSSCAAGILGAPTTIDASASNNQGWTEVPAQQVRSNKLLTRERRVHIWDSQAYGGSHSAHGVWQPAPMAGDWQAGDLLLLCIPA